jgi:hypothetical protein
MSARMGVFLDNRAIQDRLDLTPLVVDVVNIILEIYQIA